MTWSWRFPAPLDDPDLAADAQAGWESRAEAEAWLQDVYAEVADQGISEATLVDGDTAVYTMSLLGD